MGISLKSMSVQSAAAEWLEKRKKLKGHFSRRGTVLAVDTNSQEYKMEQCTAPAGMCVWQGSYCGKCRHKDRETVSCNCRSARQLSQKWVDDNCGHCREKFRCWTNK